MVTLSKFISGPVVASEHRCAVSDGSAPWVHCVWGQQTRSLRRCQSHRKRGLPVGVGVTSGVEQTGLVRFQTKDFLVP